MKITVFCSASESVDEKYKTAASEFGTQLAKHHHDVVFGGSGMGCMLAVAEAVKKGGRQVIGVISKKFHDKGIAYPHCDQLIVEKDLSARKESLLKQGDVIATLPGGIGTFDEFMDLMAAKQCKEHSKPLYLINFHNYFGPLLQQFELMKEQGFAHKSFDDLFEVVTDSDDFLDKIQRHVSEV